MLARFIQAVVTRPVTTAMVTITLVLFGLVASSRLPVELLPDLSYPSITVQTEFTDAAPAEVEELITRPVEEIVGAVPGVISVESVSREGTSEVVVDFAWGTKVDRAMADVREKLDRVGLPVGVKRPTVLRYDPSQEPIVRLALVPADPNESLIDLRRRADRRAKRELEKVPGVAAVKIFGGDEQEYRVELDLERCSALQVSAQQIIDTISSQNVNRPGGALTDQGSRYVVRTVHEAENAEDLGEMVIRNQEGRQLRLREVASIDLLPKERTDLAIVSGKPAIELAVYREGDANTVRVADDLLARIETLTPSLGGDRIVVLSNQATFIKSAVREVAENALFGGGLAILVLLFFLRDGRATVVIALAIPISLLAAFVPLRGLGVSLNLMSLGGLALGVGMLVDNSIVVLEAIAREREDTEADARLCAIRGTQQVGGSVVASTLTTVAVFLPMAFVTGVAGQLVRDLAFAVSFSILSSMLVSLTVVPVLQALVGAPKTAPDKRPAAPVAWLVAIPALAWWPIKMGLRGGGWLLGKAATPLTVAYDAVERQYPKILRLALRVRGVVLMGALALCVVAVAGARNLGQTLVPAVSQGEFFIQVRLPQGTALERSEGVTRGLMRAAETALADTLLDSDGDGEGDSPVLVYARVGSLTQAGSATGSLEGTHLAQINIALPSDIEEQELADLKASVLESMAEAELVEPSRLVLGEPALLSFSAPLEIRLFSDDLPTAVDYARTAVEQLDALDSLSDVEPDDLTGRPEVAVAFDRDRLGRAGLGVDEAALAVTRSIQGEVVGVIHDTQEQFDIRVILPQVDRRDPEDVAKVVVGYVDGVPVRLRSVATLGMRNGPAEIRRIDGKRGLRIQARVTGADLDAVAREVQGVLDQHRVEGLTTEVAGQASEMRESLLSLGLVALVSIFLVYVVMASSFESLHHPFLIMFSVPLAIVGVVAGNLVMGLPISAMTGIGAIILGGIVVNNAIVLINAVNAQRGAGKDVNEALEIAGSLRIRPILMTTATTVLGLLPMAAGLGDGAALRQPLAVAVIGGLAVSTILTLVVIPCAYALVPGKAREAWKDESTQ